MRAWLQGHRRAAVLAGAALLGLLVVVYRSRTASSTTTTTAPASLDPYAAGLADPNAIYDPNALTNGYPSLLGGGGVPTTSAVDPGSIDQLTSALGDLQNTVDALPFTLGPQAPPAAASDPLPDAVAPSSAPAGSGNGAGTQPPGAPVPPTQQGFWWRVGGKEVYVTTKNRAAFERQLARQGVSLDVWAANHPSAARAIGITPPASPPPQQPGHSSPAPVTKAPTSSIAGKSVGAVPAVDVALEQQVLTAAKTTTSVKPTGSKKKVTKKLSPAAVRI